MERKGQAFILRLVAWPRVMRRAIVVAVDLAICVLAVWVAYWLRLGEWELITRRVLVFAGIAVAVWLAVAVVTRTYRTVVRFSGRHTVLALTRSCMWMSLVLAVILFTLRIDSVPRTLSVIHPLVFFLGIVGARTAMSWLILDALQGVRQVDEAKRILIYGAGSPGEQLNAAMHQDAGYKVVGFVDDNEALRQSFLEGKPIWHSGDLELVLAMEDVDEVFIAIPEAKRTTRRKMVERIKQCKGGIGVRILPTLSQIASGRVSVNDLREVEVEELLGRDEVPPDPELMSRDIEGKRVLVTGAGGSIGSELCRQILRRRPTLLIIADQSEHALYTIDLELREALARESLDCEIQTELVNVADKDQCDRLLSKCAAHTAYHAAAYKHVPLVETNPVAGIRNNVLGTLNVCLAAERSGVAKFILVSTDKAVRPTNVMGASKRACELIIQARAEAQNRTRYCSVRFGNVLGSSGSVIPRFREQISAGGPVTITHREATRYFMTISEASQLVIQAGALADHGEILLLDMGQPVRILDLARLMIELTGLSVADGDNPDGDVAIEEIGLRPGEKLVEELLISAASETTAHPRIIKAREEMRPWDELEPRLVDLKAALDRADARGALATIMELVPEFACSVAHQLDHSDDARRLRLVGKELAHGG